MVPMCICSKYKFSCLRANSLLHSPHSGQCSDRWAASQHFVFFSLFNVWPLATFTKHCIALNTDYKRHSDSCPLICLNKQEIAY